MKKMRLLYKFFKSYTLINRRIIQYASLSLKIEIFDRQPVDFVNNDLSYEKNKDLIIGNYEATYLCDFCKLIRKKLLKDYLQTGGHIGISLLEGRYYGLIERLLERALTDCGFQFKKVRRGRSLIYITI